MTTEEYAAVAARLEYWRGRSRAEAARAVSAPGETKRTVTCPRETNRGPLEASRTERLAGSGRERELGFRLRTEWPNSRLPHPARLGARAGAARYPGAPRRKRAGGGIARMGLSPLQGDTLGVFS